MVKYFMKDSYNIDGVEIPFDKEWNSVAISLSGGADSALLAYLISSIAPDDFTINIISHKRMWKTRPWQSWDSMNVYVWLSQRFTNIRYCRHTNFIAPDIEYGNMGPTIKDEYGKMVSGDNAQIRSYAEYICSKENVQAYYNAVTRNPVGIDLGGMKERDIDRNEDNQHLEVMQHMGIWALHPFRFVDKSWVVSQYKKLNIMDLFDITRSCEGEFEDLNYKTYRLGQVVPTCGQCFWCKEREWAIEQNK
jgi:hypothetical protein